MAFLFRLSFEYEVRSLNIANIQRYNTGKNVLFLNPSDLDPRKVDLFLYKSIPFVILYQYHFFVPQNRLNYGTIRTCLRKGLGMSIRDYRGTKTDVNGNDVRFT